MATTSFTIYSHYNPEIDKERLEIETGQIPKPSKTQVGEEEEEGESEDENDRIWREATSAQFLRRQRLPPKFVPATISYEVGNYQTGLSSTTPSSQDNSLGNNLSSWYRSIITSDDGPNTTHQPFSISLPDSRSINTILSSSPSATLFSSSSSSIMPSQPQPDKKDKNNWFIQKVIQSESTNKSSSSSTPLTNPTIADILSREPPPLPSEPKYKPPVWIEIGPSNKGFMMLQKAGWNEGEALGPNVIRRPPMDLLKLSAETEFRFNEAMSISSMSAIKKGKQKVVERENPGTEKRIIKQEENTNRDVLGHVKEPEIIDLTLSDDDDDDDDESSCSEGDVEVQGLPRNDLTSTIEDISAYGRKALLTPIATVLKLDRLGIGLKAKTEGPYNASVKRVTHNGAALSAHIRAAEEARRRRDKFGRGRRGFNRQKRKEEDKRRDLLAYMNS